MVGRPGNEDMLYLQFFLVYTVKPLNRGHFGTGHLSLVERLSSSRRFCFKLIRNCLKTK